MHSKPRRIRASEEGGVGTERYSLIRAAAMRINQALTANYPLEATTLVESILAERMEKRAQHLFDHAHAPPKALMKVSNGFATLGELVAALQVAEHDLELRRSLEAISGWSRERNKVIHGMAKLGTNARDIWQVRHDGAIGVARRGIAVLLDYDRHERRVCHHDRQRLFSSATCPDALVPIGQAACEWCARGGSELREPRIMSDEYIEKGRG